MGRTTAEKDLLTTTVRLSAVEASFIESLAETGGSSFNSAVRQLVQDARGFYGLPEAMVAPLEAEADALGKNRREYILHVLSRHAVELIKAEARREVREKKRRPVAGF
jgi:hypothetical protein